MRRGISLEPGAPECVIKLGRKYEERDEAFFCGNTALLALRGALVAAPARAAEATFERDLTVSGRVDLAINNGSGSIHLTNGPAGHVHIFGRVQVQLGRTTMTRSSEIAAHPPIEQTGNIVRIGAKHENLNNISIDYEIQAPARRISRCRVRLRQHYRRRRGRKCQIEHRLGIDSRHWTQGGFTVGTGSGNIYAEQVGAGDVKAETGSGSIELKNLHGGLHAETGSGHVKVEGAPTASWLHSTGSGSVELWTENAGLTLDASTGSGGIHTDREISSQGTMDRHHLKGTIGGGGPEVRVETGSGSIKIH